MNPLFPPFVTRYDINFPINPHGRLLVGLSVCHYFLKSQTGYTSIAPIGALVSTYFLPVPQGWFAGQSNVD